MKCGIVIPAAGRGRRMGANVNKQFIPLDGKPILIHTLEKFSRLPWVDEIVIVSHPDEITIMEQLVQQYGIQRVKAIVPGGKERQDSIYNGLTFLETEYVMVHDGARPFVKQTHLEQLWQTVQKIGAVALGVPVKDTIKIVDQDGFIQSTPDRKSLWAIQTPQAFRLSILRMAYEEAKKDRFLGTDDSSLVERLGMKVMVVEGDYHNIKITTPEDLILAESILKHWSEEV
ncbi:2-C-methyl-D-erythritol 4-phosphate cytidylyltransferase [Tepidibacillus fermentans]|uniref:2-C-methyl-D-erythritol 4-phosphate cytidylyltransferase n=2 Tax=Tepidibacillus fermentans TaxID=1281767 RepID=A0A4R3KER3_9BACI|nr:2-C-methyl-D-erythritol 4-phosphate cytidylyltransferase [Tepidibacillus fermentans]